MAEEKLTGKVADCIAQGGADRSRQFLDIGSTICPFSVWYEIEGQAKPSANKVPCPHVGESEHHTRGDKKTLWYYRVCFYPEE